MISSIYLYLSPPPNLSSSSYFSTFLLPFPVPFHHLHHTTTPDNMLAANHALLSSTANGTTTTSTTNSSNNNNNDGEHDPADHLTRQPFPPLTLSDFDFFSAAAASAANNRPSYTMSDGADSHSLLLNTSATTTTTSSASVDFLKHRKSSDIDDSSLNLPASPLATTATADELGGASPSLLTEEQSNCEPTLGNRTFLAFLFRTFYHFHYDLPFYFFSLYFCISDHCQSDCRRTVRPE